MLSYKRYTLVFVETWPGELPGAQINDDFAT